jgi:hypothetical protein
MLRHLLLVDTAVAEHWTDVVLTFVVEGVLPLGVVTSLEQENIAIEVIATIMIFFIVVYFLIFTKILIHYLILTIFLFFFL